MLDVKLNTADCSIRNSSDFEPGRYSLILAPSQLDLVLFRIVKWGTIVTTTVLYLQCHQWNVIFGFLMASLFAYSLAGLVHLLVDSMVYLFTEPVLLPEIPGVLRDGIPTNCKVAFIRPIFAKTNPEMDTLLTNMRRDLLASQEPSRHQKFIVIDNTKDEHVRDFVRTRVRALQNEFGKDVVFYFHRNPKCDFFKKLGIFQDLVMFLREGWTQPRHYTDKKWEPWTRGTRNQNDVIWDEILGDIRALGILTPAEDVIAGREAHVSSGDKIDIAFICDADNFWPEGQPKKIVAKFLHPSNHEVTIFQPKIELANPDENGFIRLNSWARSIYGFDPIAKWRLYRFSPFYGKGAIKLSSYAEDIIKSEALHPGKAASHDFQESLKTNTVLLEDVYLMEKTFANKLSELTRGSQWLWGDMETVQQYLLKPFSPGRKEHLWMLLRVIFGPIVFGLWILGTILAWMCSTVANEQLLWAIFLGIATAHIIIPKFIVPCVTLARNREGNVAKPVSKILTVGVFETVLSTLIHSLDLVYKSQSVLANVYKQITGKEFVWITTAAQEMEIADLTLLQTYQRLIPSTVIGGILLLGVILNLFPQGLSWFLAPFTASFLLGPLVIWLTAKPLKRPGLL